VIPIIAPRIIKKPIDPIVLPNPSLIVFIIVSAGRVVKASNKETIKSAIKACNLSLVVRIIIKIIQITTSRETTIAFMARKKLKSQMNFTY
jgi:hypothetical protein